ncbi:hypothetical protein [Streptomyces sp. N50]|uniref:hypothetical protein n=1 Tax=Streptomyces sp. N50 TaxID=3081765 RepID=UPI002961F7B0|nr:hypothetical protein [Streptomyces sp. N50]WOX14353.1 hypothetical protein R2B38_38380 [Streptomyces sp. N50]
MSTGRATLRCLQIRRGTFFQRTKTWKESRVPAFDAKLDRPLRQFNVVHLKGS